MTRALLLTLLAVPVWADSAVRFLDLSSLDAVRQQRLTWMKTRRTAPALGIYQDFRAVAHDGTMSKLTQAAKEAGVHIVLGRETRVEDGIVLLARSYVPTIAQPRELPRPAQLKSLFNRFITYPDEIAGLTRWRPEVLAQILGNRKGQLDLSKLLFRRSSLHVLARDLSVAEVQRSLEDGRTYESEDWLCETAGFYLWASNNQGVYEIGDQVPLFGGTRLQARLPVEAKVKIFRGIQLVEEKMAQDLNLGVKDPGDYHLEAELEVAGQWLPWIKTNVLRMGPAPTLALPNFTTSPDVRVVKDIDYVGNGLAKQKLDLHLPKDQSGFPVLVFVHGGGWTSGDRALYAPLGDRFARLGMGVVIPSYRLMPQHAYPAQIDDVAAAFAWVVKNIEAQGGDPKRIYLAGHSAGGHLASLLALDARHLDRFGINTSVIRGVASLSGVYDVGLIALFGKDLRERAAASPAEYIRKDSPPFLITYCQYDYFALPFQAREFHAALKRAFVPAELVYVPGLTHITEILNMMKDDDVTFQALRRFIH